MNKGTHTEIVMDVKGEVQRIIREEVQNILREGMCKALEQEPIQVELEGDGCEDGYIVYDYGKCPECGWQYEEGDKDWKEPFCCHCGQKLKWFEE